MEIAGRGDDFGDSGTGLSRRDFGFAAPPLDRCALVEATLRFSSAMKAWGTASIAKAPGPVNHWWRKTRGAGCAPAARAELRGGRSVPEFCRKLGYAPDELLFMTKLL